MGFGNTDSYRIVNPNAGTFYKTTADVAIAGTNQPKVNGGSMIYGNGDDPTRADSPINAIALGSTETEIYGSQINMSTTYASGAIPTRDFATMTAGRYIMRRGGANTEWIAGVADTTLRSGGSDYGIRRSINARTVVRGPLTAAAIRNNQWNEFSGNWTTDPTASTDGLGNVFGNTSATQTAAAATGADQAVFPTGGIPGELVYIAGNSSTILVPKQDDYKIRTTN